MQLRFRILDATEEAIVKSWLRRTRGDARRLIVELMAQALRTPDQRTIEQLVKSPRTESVRLDEEAAR
jgi:hypothetical protein